MLIDSSAVVSCSESTLTGEQDDRKKSKGKDCFLLSSCLISDCGDACRAMVFGIGLRSQYGKIKATLTLEQAETPLQAKLEQMTKEIGYIGMVFAIATFLALLISIWTVHHGENAGRKVVEAFIIGITIVVVAIPEGLPLAVTISLAYSTKKMYADQCNIRVLAACETMGNATNICSDKTGTLTENRMSVIEGWFADKYIVQGLDFEKNQNEQILESSKRLIIEHASVNRTAYLIFKDSAGKLLPRPAVVGSSTEGALILMCRSWGHDYEEVKTAIFNETRGDKVFPFNSNKKRSTAIIHRPDGSVTLFCKGASEWLLKDCSLMLNSEGKEVPMTAENRTAIGSLIEMMADKALRTLLLAHIHFAKASDLPVGWEDNPPDTKGLCCDCIVGIMDPLREDVKEAVEIAQRAGVLVRMVTGDNISTARAIAKNCGILTEGGLAIEGPTFRNMTPQELDAILPRLQVMARSSPEDKFLLVTRLNGLQVPKDKAEWEERFKAQIKDQGVTWETHRDKLLPGYLEEWKKTRPEGGQVVGVTGDGTNDAPALKAADVGLSMGITGTKTAQKASDIIILDDRFSSIVRSIMWGRSVYDNIRKFLQFQLTVNIVALLLVFIGAVCGFGEPLTAVQMLWVNLVMDTLGALALGTEAPTKELLLRKPYKRSSSLISRPMMRNIAVQSILQLILLFILMFAGPSILGIKDGESCFEFKLGGGNRAFSLATMGPTDGLSDVTCSDFASFCPHLDRDCYEKTQLGMNHAANATTQFSFHDLSKFKELCLKCEKVDYTHGTVIFNTFIFCQIFNEYNSRLLLDELNMFYNVHTNFLFILVSIVSIGLQIFLVEVGGEFMKTTPLNLKLWIITILLGFLSVPVSIVSKLLFRVKEDPNSFFDSTKDYIAATTAAEGGEDDMFANPPTNSTTSAPRRFLEMVGFASSSLSAATPAGESPSGNQIHPKLSSYSNVPTAVAGTGNQ